MGARRSTISGAIKSKHIVYFDQLDGQRRDYVELELDQETPFICMKAVVTNIL